ncbi:MAG: hypothetical protein DA328_00255 [Nitrososphaeraceae archaeon]|nr:hypothetical protein [Nitrososphaeraceae archaeon]
MKEQASKTSNTINYRGQKIINTYQREADIWNFIDRLTSFSYVYNLLNERIKENFFDIDISKTNKLKKEFMNLNKTEGKNDKNLPEIHERLTSNNLVTNAEEIVLLAKQAIDFFNTSKIVSLITKPILLYNCYARLLKILFLSTFRKSQISKGSASGLYMENNTVVCKITGSFARSLDCYFSDPRIYLHEYRFDWTDLFINLPISEYDIYFKNDNYFVDIPEQTTRNQYSVHELTREILFIFSLNFFSRYRLSDWNKIIEGRSSDLIWKINEYIKSTCNVFPTLILNELHGQRFLFKSGN